MFEMIGPRMRESEGSYPGWARALFFCVWLTSMAMTIFGIHPKRVDWVGFLCLTALGIVGGSRRPGEELKAYIRRPRGLMTALAVSSVGIWIGVEIYIRIFSK